MKKTIKNLKYYIRLLYHFFINLYDKGKKYDDMIFHHIECSQKLESKLCIFSHYDKDGQIDDYVVYYLQAIKKLGTNIVFVSTAEQMSLTEVQKISDICQSIIIKKNEGYDFGAWKTGFLLSRNMLARYEQLILCNDSVYLPLYDLNEMFHKMDHQYDFWGITDNYELGYHIQSYFMVFEKNIFLEQSFSNFWNNIRIFRYKESIIKNYELGITKLVFQNKHSLGVYCPSEVKSFKNSTHYEWKKLIIEQRSPILKIELLRDNPKGIDITDYKSILSTYTTYDLNLIKNHLMRMARKLNV